MNTVFMDYSGHIKDRSSRIISYAALLVNEEQAAAIEKTRSELTAELKNTILSNVKVEYHAVEMFSGSGLWRKLDQPRRMRLLTGLRDIIVNMKIPFAVLLINKEEGGLKSIKELESSHSAFGKLLTDLSIEKEVRDMLNKTLPGITLEKLKREPLTNIIGLLFGLIVGLVNRNRDIGIGAIIADSQFVRQTDLWKAIFTISKYYLDRIASAGAFLHGRRVSLRNGQFLMT